MFYNQEALSNAIQDSLQRHLVSDLIIIIQEYVQWENDANRYRQHKQYLYSDDYSQRYLIFQDRDSRYKIPIERVIKDLKVSGPSDNHPEYGYEWRLIVYKTRNERYILETEFYDFPDAPIYKVRFGPSLQFIYEKFLTLEEQELFLNSFQPWIMIRDL